MTPRVKSTLKISFSIGLSLFFLYFAFRGTDFPKLATAMAEANYWYIVAMLPVLILSHMVRAWRWKYLLYPVKQNIRYRSLFSSLMVGYMVNNVLPRAGEIVRPYALAKLEGISRSTSFGTVLVERIFDIISFMSLIILIPLVYSGPLMQTFPWLEEAGVWLTSITFAFLFASIFLMLRRDVVMRLLSFFTRRLSPRKTKLVEHIVHSFLDGFLFVKNARHYVIIAVLSIVVWGLYIIMMYIPFYAFGFTTLYDLDLSSAMVVQAISSIGIVMPTPGATGPYHYFTIQTLTKLYGVNDELARSYATLTHAISFIGVTLTGLVYFVRDNLRISEVVKEERTSSVKENQPA